MASLKRTWAEIDLNAIEHNYYLIKSHIKKKCKLMCVVKADAYGHGAVKLAEFYEKLGADYLAVSNIEEAIQIRNSAVSLPILILGYTPCSLCNDLYKNNITQTVISKKHAKELSELAKQLGIILKIHVKLDTGMSRLGILAQNNLQEKKAIEDIHYICNLDNLYVEGIFTHMATADSGESGCDFTCKQYQHFFNIVQILKKMGIHIPLKHCCNSGCIIDYPGYAMDMVRAGIILYGLMPSNCTKNRLDLIPAMKIKTAVSYIKTLPCNSTVSYGGIYITEKETKVATVPIGYADGYDRALSSKAFMIIKGKKAPVIGKICMDQCMLDVSSIDEVNEGDTVTVIGKEQDIDLSVDAVSHMCGKIGYETICLVGKRVPRVYYYNDKIVGSLNYIIRNSNVC